MKNILIKNAQVVSPSGTLGAELLVEDGKIKKISRLINAEHTEVFDARGSYACVGFIDLHIHGFGGRGTEEGTAEAVLEMSETLAVRGVTAFCPTLYPGSREQMIKNLKTVSAAVGKEKGAKILGFHLEGPFISPQKPGVMKPQDIAPVDTELLKRLYDASAGMLKIMTFAPEIKDSDKIIDFARGHNILLQAGHTNASYEQMADIFEKGVTHVTHLFNAMSQFNHRAPGAAGAALMKDFSVEIIADDVHVHPALVGFLGRIKKPEQIVLVTDSLRPTGQISGVLLANNEPVIFKDNVFKRESDGVIAGSALTMINGVKNLVSYGFSLENAVSAATANPAKVAGLKEVGLSEGNAADITFFDKDFNIKAAFIDGKRFV
jgi:N-acetylglucosamine-6-phosphate deacetylase